LSIIYPIYFLSHEIFIISNFSEMYVRDVKSGICDGSAVPLIVKSSPATALVDGNNGLGPVVGNFCMDIATKKARETGVGWVAAKGEKLINICCQNTVFEI
jgi:LDH2 family malate/lactate/ureidoglycolate dehydrogenase